MNFEKGPESRPGRVNAEPVNVFGKKISPGESGALEKVSGVRCQPAAGLNSEPQNRRISNHGISNNEFRRMGSLREIFFKTDRMHSFDVRCSTFISFFLD